MWLLNQAKLFKVLEGVAEATVRFSALPSLCADRRLDRARRFVAVVFLEHEQKVDLFQMSNDLMVAIHEVDGERQGIP